MKGTHKNNSSKPLVSVLMPSYRQAQYISDALDSLLNQTYSNWEVAVVDDGSPDNVAEILKKYSKKDSRIKFYHPANHGVSAARNFGAAHTSGEFLLALDADDIIDRRYIEKCVERFMMYPDTRLVYCQWEYFGYSHETPDLKYRGYKALLLGNSIFNAAMIRRDDFNSIGGYDETMVTGLEDWEMWIRLLDESAIVYQIPERLFRYRIKEYSRNVSVNTGDTAVKVHNYIYKKHISIYERYYGSAIHNIHQACTRKEHDERIRRKSFLSRAWRVLRGRV